MERCTRVHLHVRPGHFADAGIHRARVFRRDSGGTVRRAARQPVDGHADAHPAGGPDVLRLRIAWRHQARAADAGRSQGSLRIRRAVLRSRRSIADPDFRDARSRHRHAGLGVRSADLERPAASRSRQGHDLRAARSGQRFRPLPRRRRRWHPVPHLPGHAPQARVVLHARHDQGSLRPVHGGGPRLRRQHAAPAAQVRDGQAVPARAGTPQCLRADAPWCDLLRFDGAGDGRNTGGADRAEHPSRHAAHPGVSVPRLRSRISSPITTAYSSSSRTAMRSCA